MAALCIFDNGSLDCNWILRKTSILYVNQILSFYGTITSPRFHTYLLYLLLEAQLLCCRLFPPEISRFAYHDHVVKTILGNYTSSTKHNKLKYNDFCNNTTWLSCCVPAVCFCLKLALFSLFGWGSWILQYPVIWLRLWLIENEAFIGLLHHPVKVVCFSGDFLFVTESKPS